MKIWYDKKDPKDKRPSDFLEKIKFGCVACVDETVKWIKIITSETDCYTTLHQDGKNW